MYIENMLLKPLIYRKSHTITLKCNKSQDTNFMLKSFTFGPYSSTDGVSKSCLSLCADSADSAEVLNVQHKVQTSFFLNSNVFNSRNSGHSLLSSFGIVPGLFQFTSPGTFALLKSRDDRTTGTSRSLGPVLSSPGTQNLLSWDFPGRPWTYLEGYLRQKSIQRYMFFHFCKFFFWQNCQFLIVNLSNELQW